MSFYRNLLTGLFTVAFSAQILAQAAPAPVPVGGNSPAPATTPAAPVLSPALTQPLTPGITNVPFKNASFEEPVVPKRTADIEGGNPSIEAADWAHCYRRKGEGEGTINIGLTNEIARTGKQSLFLDFAAITGKRFSATLITRLIPVKPQTPYRVGMWGRLDKERPLTLDQRRPFLRMEFEFYLKDEETQAGDTDYRVMQIPGAPKRLLFSSANWNRGYGIVRAPLGAEVMKVTYSFNIRNEPGKTDGVIFFDDAFIEELPADFPVQAPSEVAAEPEDADDTGATAKPAAVEDGTPKTPAQPR